ncbi:hypothetical protein JW859_09275 [bacterium]|nr:hypothetical protein [bacterium]
MSFRRILAWWAGLLALVAGFGGFYAVYANQQRAYTGLNITSNQPIPHPTTKLQTATASPARELAVGQVLHVTAHTNEPAPDAFMYLKLEALGYPYEQQGFMLTDDGRAADDIAADGIWHGEGSWRGDSEVTLSVQAILHFKPDAQRAIYENQTFDLSPIKVVPEQSEGHD